jgi:alkanesulfonate monooxygenase SsuD/methylene tetrahydromethanopterin reductase-like flavin-dependent oxidoreductase (luciferase family)
MTTTTPPARIGVAFGRGLGPADVVACVKLAEDLGYESAWMTEGHAGDQFAVLGGCAVATRRIALGTAISSVFVRSAPTIAMAAATVDHLSGGRFVLGLGTSHREQVVPEHGLTFSRPTDRLRDTVEIVRALLRDGAVSHAGRVVRIERFDLWFAPRRRQIPVYIAALFPTMLEIAGEIADGVLLTWPTLDAPRRAAEHVRRGAERAGRDPRGIVVASLIPCAVAASRREALEVLRPGVALYAGYFPRYNRVLAESGFAEEVRAIKSAWDAGDHEAAARAVPAALIDAVAIAGTAEQCRERIEDYRRAGLALPIISPRAAGGDAARATMDAIRACAP